MQCTVISNRRKAPPAITPTPEVILPYFGAGPITDTYDEALILALPSRGESPSRFGSFNLTTTNQQYMYYCYPAEYGEAKFIDRDNNMEGGWDGALMHQGQLGPATVNVHISGRGLVPFYVYRSEWPWNGSSRWRVS